MSTKYKVIPLIPDGEGDFEFLFRGTKEECIAWDFENGNELTIVESFNEFDYVIGEMYEIEDKYKLLPVNFKINPTTLLSQLIEESTKIKN